MTAAAAPSTHLSSADHDLAPALPQAMHRVASVVGGEMQVAFLRAADAAGLTHRASHRFLCDRDAALAWRPPRSRCIASVNHDAAVYVTRAGTVMTCDVTGNMIEIVVAASSRSVANRTAERIRTRLEVERREDERVAMPLWTAGAVLRSGSPNPMIRRVKAQPWSEIAANYPDPVRASLDELMQWQALRAGGLLIWHGPPGTGKTTALRTLAREWNNWCSLEVVVDANALLGDADYLVKLMAAGSHRGRSRLILLEDSGELVAADARSKTGQALSKILNATDGIIASGEIAFAITTNEPISRMHDAILRPGRCSSNLDFRAFTAVEADTWLDEHAPSERVAGADPGQRTLAELYAIARGEQLPAPLQSIGFAHA